MNLKHLVILALGLLLPGFLRAGNFPPVQITEDDFSFTLNNGVVSAQVAKRSGNLIALQYQAQEILDVRDHEAAYWSHNVAHDRQASRITIDPRANGGERGEVSLTGFAATNGPQNLEVEIRYTLARGDSGLYTYSILSHATNYPATSIGEARFCMKLNDELFDWMTVDGHRDMKMITAYDWNHGTEMNFKEGRRMNTGQYKGMVEHKYDYSANQFAVRAWGWSSSARQIGIWLVNPSVEYLSGGPTKFELSAHRDATFRTNAFAAPAPPTLLNYWRSSHYGGSVCNLAATDAWSKVVGPFLIYCNAHHRHHALWQDALARADVEARAWPYDWVKGVDYPHKNERATVAGTVVLDDPQAPQSRWKHLLVGLTAPDYTLARIPRSPRNGGRTGEFGPAGGGEDEANNTNDPAGLEGRTNAPSRVARGNDPRSDFRRRGGGGGSNDAPHQVDWQMDARNYEFWIQADDKGRFAIPNVRPGTYTLRAIADGVLGELAVSNVVVSSGRDLNLGALDWQPVRHGKQLWEIGIPNRTGAEFFKGDDYFHWGWYLQYPKLFPNDVNYVIGKSDFRKDWFFEQVPHNEDPNNTTGRGRGRATTWTITFNLPDAPAGRATLRLAICGVGARTLLADLNARPLGAVTNLMYNATLNRDGIGGYWSEHDLVFDAALMHAGKNVLGLTVPAGPLMNGIIYDYLRLELDENAGKTLASDSRFLKPISTP